MISGCLVARSMAIRPPMEIPIMSTRDMSIAVERLVQILRHHFNGVGAIGFVRAASTAVVECNVSVPETHPSRGPDFRARWHKDQDAPPMAP